MNPSLQFSRRIAPPFTTWLMLAALSAAFGQTQYSFTNLAGSPGASGSADGTGAAARFKQPGGVAVDNTGNIYVADSQNATIRLVTAGGIVATFAGSAGQLGFNDGIGTAARFVGPAAVAVDGAGNLYIADNSSIRKITPAGVVTTVPGGAGSPAGIAVDSAGNIYFTDGLGNAIHKITAAGVSSTIAGTTGQSGSADGTGAAARFNSPHGMAVDSAGNIYVADSGNATIRKITPTGAVTTFAGSAGQSGSADGVGGMARFSEPMGLATDSSGNLFVTDSFLANTIRMVKPDGTVTTIGGTYLSGGTADGIGAAARFSEPGGIAVDSAGNLYVADTSNNRISIGKPLGTVPVVTQQPQSQIIAVGQAATLTAAVNGTAPLSYQWQFNGSSISGATSATLTIPNAAASNSGNYTILVTNSAGSTTSSVAILTVDTPPSFPTSPASQVVAEHGGATLTASPAGSSPFTYQWYKNGTVITGATNASLSLTNVQPGDIASYTVVATNPVGKATSQAATLALLPSYAFTNFAGSPAGTGSADGVGASARFNECGGTAVDAAGNVYVADVFNDTIRKIAPSGAVTTLAGSASQGGSVDGTGAAARFFFPSGVAVDGSGNVFVTDGWNRLIRKITAAGVVTTFAGNLVTQGSVDGTGTAAGFGSFSGITVDGSGNLYVAEATAVRKVTPAGVVTTLTSAATGAPFISLAGIAVDANGNVYVSDLPASIYKITVGGTVSKFAGNGVGYSDGPIASAKFYYPQSLTIDAGGNLYVDDKVNAAIRKITPSGTVSTLAGGVLSGNTDGTGGAARFCACGTNLSVDRQGNLYGGDTSNNEVRKITPAGAVTTIAGSASQGYADGTGIDAKFSSPVGAALDVAGNVFVADRGNEVIRKITSAGVVTTFAGTAGAPGNPVDGTGAAARFGPLLSIAADGSGNIYVSDGSIRKVTPAGVVTTLASSSVISPVGIAVDPAGNLFVANSGGASGPGLVKITPAGAVSTVASASATGFSVPQSVALDSSGNAYLTDINGSVCKVTPTGAVTVLASSVGAVDIAVDGSGNVFYSDEPRHAIHRIAPDGTVTTIGGTPGTSGAADGAGTAALFNQPIGLAIDSNGNLYVADSGNNRISKGTPINGSQSVIIAQQPQSQGATAGTAVVLNASAVGTGAPALSYQWQKDGIPIAGATAAAFTIPSVQAADAGDYSVVVTGGAGSTTSSLATLTVSAPVPVPVFGAQPNPQNAAVGSTVTLRAPAAGTPAPAYQWFKDGNAVAGASSAILVVSGTTVANAGNYYCVATNALGSTTSTSAALTVTSTPNVGRLINLSVRANAGTGSQTLTVGFVIGGAGVNGTETLLIRGVGPTLGTLGVSGALSHAILTVSQSSNVIASDDGWGTSQAIVTAADAATGAFPLTDPTSLDSALVASLPDNSYTAQITGSGGTTGVALAEVYDNTALYTPTSPRLVNLSARTQVGTGSNILIAGFVIGGSTAKTVLIRAIGPALAPLGVTGTLSDPQLTLHTSVNGQDTIVASNSGWGGDPQLISIGSSVGAFPLSDLASKDSMLLLTLAPGAYTAQVASQSGATGVALVEVYEVP